MTIEIRPVEGLPEIAEGDDLAGLLAGPLHSLGAREGDVVAVTQKIVSKAEGRVVPAEGDERSGWIERETRRVVARRGDLVIVETGHGFVCANAGVDASNVAEGFVSLLPDDPDASAVSIRAGLRNLLEVDALGVVVTDTFGRPWRNGVVNVAIGSAGLPVLVDLRGTPDHLGRALEVTVVALADEIAAASGLAMGKSARVPAALIRGVDVGVAAAGVARDLVRPPDEDLFRTSPLTAVAERRDAAAFGPGDVARATVEEAVRAALAGGTGEDLMVSALASPAARRRLLLATGERDPALGSAPLLLVPWLRVPPGGAAPTERERIVGSAAAFVERLLLALDAQGLAARWDPDAGSRGTGAREAAGVRGPWYSPGTIGVGRPPAGGAPSPRPPIDLGHHLGWR